MEHYTHDYTKVEEAEERVSWVIRHLDEAGKQIIKDVRIIKDVIEKAQSLLREYLASDNLVLDNDGVGLIHPSTTFDEDQMVFIRDIFAERLHETTGHSRTFDDMLEIINLVQRDTGCDEYSSVDEFRADKSGTFVERSR